MAMEHPGEPPNSTTPLFSSNEIDMTEFGYERKDLEKFCSEQIRIPPKLPNILKTFTKAAMRTQPRDLVHWTGAYFRALAEGQVPPVKETLEYPQVESKDGLTVGYLRVLNNQVSQLRRTCDDNLHNLLIVLLGGRTRYQNIFKTEGKS